MSLVKNRMTRQQVQYPARGYNFGAGPAMLPERILHEAQAEFLNWQQTGMSILETGHRTEAFRDLLDEAEARLRGLLKIPSDYHVLFLSGPARMLFSMIPMNFLTEGDSADYLVTGIWSQMALKEAQKLKQAKCVATGADSNFTTIPLTSSWNSDPNSKYFYYTPNETVNGIYCSKPTPLMTKGHDKTIPLIADMTSCLLAEPINVADYGLIFAGAQKNIANSGLTLVIVHDQLIQTIKDNKLPTLYDFRTHIEHRSLYSTPPTFNCYLANKMFAWIESQGGVDALYAMNQQKAKTLYQFIDDSDFYTCPVDKPYRSIFNVCFNVPSHPLEDIFVEQAQNSHLFALRGHRLVGGLRASLYNAMPQKGVDSLIDLMQDFAQSVSASEWYATENHNSRTSHQPFGHLLPESGEKGKRGKLFRRYKK